MTGLLLWLAIGALAGVLGLYRTYRRERKLAVAERRAEARALAAHGYDAVPSWTIRHPQDPVLADPRENAAYQAARRRGL